MSQVLVVGLGKLGACMAGVFADAGHVVVGYDVDSEAVRKFDAGIAPVDEPGLQELYDANEASLLGLHSLSLGVGCTDIAFIIVPTPSKPSGAFNSKYVVAVARQIGHALRNHRDKRYTIVVSSTVMPGTCRRKVQPAVNDAAGRTIPVIYSPEFIALGSVVRDMRNPDVVLVGTDSPDGVDAFGGVMRDVVIPGARWSYLSTVDAEIAKISVNSYVTMKISFANQLAGICEGVKGADASEVLRAIGGDSRIGSKYLQVGGPYGGPCFPRDNRAFQCFAQKAGAVAPLAAATDEVNQTVLDRLMGLIPIDMSLAVLGLTYKPGTHVREESFGGEIVEWYPYADAHDPTLSEGRSAQQLVDASECVVVATPWSQYQGLDYSKCRLVIDVWGYLPVADNTIRLGRGVPY